MESGCWKVKVVFLEERWMDVDDGCGNGGGGDGGGDGGGATITSREW